MSLLLARLEFLCTDHRKAINRFLLEQPTPLLNLMALHQVHVNLQSVLVRHHLAIAKLHLPILLPLSQLQARVWNVQYVVESSAYVLLLYARPDRIFHLSIPRGHSLRLYPAFRQPLRLMRMSHRLTTAISSSLNALTTRQISSVTKNHRQ